MKRSMIPILLLFLVAIPAAAFAGMALVPKSGQTLCYDAAGTEIPCAGTGQDGDQQMGIPWPAPRFSDNGNGTVTDNLTGLIWLKNAGCFRHIYPWSSALSIANTLANGACGLTDGSVAGDWRLPNRKELESLINRQQSNPAAWLNTVGFSGVDTGTYTYSFASYWSSSTLASSTDYVWNIYFGIGITANTYKHDNCNVLPVRGGQ